MSEFLRPRLTGPRFDEGQIPLEMLGELSAVRELVIEVAKWKYLEANPTRRRSPKGFATGISLSLAGVEKGSATAVIDAEFHPPQALDVPQLPGMPGMFDQYYEEARDAIIDAIAAADTDSLTAEHLPERCLEYFDRIGRGLREDESIEFTSPTRMTPARLTKESRRRLLFASRIEEVTEEVRLRGTIPEADQDRMSFELVLPEGRKIKAAMRDQDQDDVLEVFSGYKDDRKALIQGMGKFDRQGNLVRLETIEELVALDPLDVPSRLSELQKLEHGWLDGEGSAPGPDFLEWLSARFEHMYPEELPLPHLYPTVKGGVQAEWSIPPIEASLEIDGATHAGEWHEINMDTDAERTAVLNLDESNDWLKLAQFVRSLEEASE